MEEFEIESYEQAIIPSSGKKIRAEWISLYEKIEKKLLKLKQEWNQYEAEAQELFRNWYHTQYAGHLSEVRSLEEQAEQKRRILSAIQAQITINLLTRAKAYQKVMAAILRKADPFPTAEEEERYRKEQIKSFAEDFQKTRDLFDTEVADDWLTVEDIADAEPLTRENTEEAREPSEFAEYFKSLFGDDEEAPGASDLKTLYRKIVRLLHPDRGTEMNAQEKEFWSQTQNAYRLKEIDTLRMILMRVEGGGRIDVHKIESIGEIRDLTQSLHYEFSNISFFKNRIRKEAVYRFWASRTRPVNRMKLELQLKRGLQNQISFHNRVLRQLSSELHHIKITSKE
jgi:hypothetical protein